MQRELAVAAAFDAELGDDLERGGPQHLIVFIGEGQSGCDDDGIARMHADGVEILHRADGEHVPRAVAQDFELDLLPAADVLFDEHLRDGREHEPVVGDEAELLLVVRDAAARAAQRERGAHDDGIAELFCDLNALVHRIGNVRRNDGLMDLLHRLLEELAVLRPVDGVELGADELDPPFVQETGLGELAAHRKAGLAAEGGKQGVGTLLDDDALQTVLGEGFEVNFVCEHLIRHDGRRVGVAEDDVDARILQNTARLCARIVEFRRLTDDDGAGADDKYLFDVASLRH